MSGLMQQFSTLPRFAKWLIYCGLLLVVFFVIINPALSVSDSISTRASRLEQALSSRNEFDSPSGGKGKVITDLQALYGTPFRPGGGLNPESFRRVVNGILENHNIFDSTINERPKTALSGVGPDQAAALGVSNVDRLVLEVTFEAHPEEVVAILAEMERSPEVAAVSRVKIDRSISRLSEDDHLVRATLTPEAWLASSGFSNSPSSSESIP